jgi:hypothetical protein
VRDADHDSVARRIEGELERLLDDDGADRRSVTPERVAQDRCGPERRVLARSAAGQDDRPALVDGLRDRRREGGGRGARGGEARQEATGEVRLGRDHVGHVVRRRGPERRRIGRLPRGRHGPQRRGRVEVGGRHRGSLGSGSNARVVPVQVGDVSRQGASVNALPRSAMRRAAAIAAAGATEVA